MPRQLIFSFLPGNNQNNNNNASSSVGTQHACASLCEELVTLWRLAALCPANLQEERVELDLQLREWHIKTVEKVSWVDVSWREYCVIHSHVHTHH